MPSYPARTTLARAEHHGEGGKQYAARLMQLAEARGVSVLWFNAPADERPERPSVCQPQMP
jgi:hypothetical protein